MKLCRRAGSVPRGTVMLAVALLVTVFPLFALAQSSSNTIKVDPAARASYTQVAASISADRINQTIHALSSIQYPILDQSGKIVGLAQGRLAGSLGDDQARDYVKAQFDQIFGARDVSVENFPVTIPVDHGASISVGGGTYPLRGLWPNLVRTSTLPASGISGPVIYAGQGDLRSFSGKEVQGSVVLLDFNSGTNWLNAPRLGARAVIFVEPTNPIRGEAESKFVGIPVNIPRFWISRSDAAKIESSALTTPSLHGTVNAYQPWERRTASNIIGVIPGSDPVLKNQIVVVEGYYDSMSVVPSLAPGAESATGIASLLEIARTFASPQNRPKRTIFFVASGAHFVGLEGVRQYIDRHLEQWQQPSYWDRIIHSASFHSIGLPKYRQQVLLFSGIDLSSQTSSVGVFYKGNFYDFREDIQGNFADLGRTLRENSQKIGQVLGFDADASFGDGIDQIGGKSWRNYLPGTFAFDAEAATIAGGIGITFASTDDSRRLSDTPADAASNVNVANVFKQTRILACQYWDLFNDTNDRDQIPNGSAKGLMPIEKWPVWTRQGLQLGFATLKGRVLLFDPKKNFVPDQAVAGSLAVITNPVKTMVGVRGNLIEGVYGEVAGGRDAQFSFPGLPLSTSQNRSFKYITDASIHSAAFHIHETDDALGHRGDVDYAPDQGMTGSQIYPTIVSLDTASTNIQVIVFPCVATSIFDLIDQQALSALTGVNIYDGVTNGYPRQYGFILAGNEPNVSYTEDVAVLFSSPGPDTRLKVVMDSGPAATRFLLINALPPLSNLSNEANRNRAQGIGYAVGEPSDNVPLNDDPDDPNHVVRYGAISNTALRVAQDMWNLDEYRIDILAKYRIINDELHNPKTHQGLHDIAHDYIERSLTAYRHRNYADFDAYSRAAWAYEAKVYPQAQSTASDVVAGVIFYLFLLIPFAYFLERLLIAAPTLREQLIWLFGIFVGIFIIFSQIHPAFQISTNPFIVLIGFVMLALSVIVSLVVWGKFEEWLAAFRRTLSGVHKTEVGKASVAFAAFSLGISNMRRRKERTLLTCITLILLTFTVLSFTSVVTYIRPNDVPAEGTAPYNGIMIRLPDWSAMQDPAYRLLNDEYGRTYPVAPRAWFFGTSHGQQTFLKLKRAQTSVDLKGVLGMTSQEAGITDVTSCLVTGPDGKPEGRWFNPADSYSILIPSATAGTLGITPAELGKATVNFSGLQFVVIGIYDNAKFNQLRDLDDEGLPPVDFSVNAAQHAMAEGTPPGFTQFTHLDSTNIAIVPYRTLTNLGSGGGLASVAINFGSAATTAGALKDLVPRLNLNIYAGENGHNHRFSAMATTSPSGLQDIVIPIILASLIVWGTMLGAVYERVKEIRTFSSIGLSPGNIAMLFIAEALVYAVVGAVSGYLIGQALSKIISVFNILPGLTLNFSSTSAEMSIGVVIAVVLLSTIFPARKASQVASPSLDSTWKVPEPDGDHWTIMLPFAVTGEQTRGINAFLIEWFRSYEEQSVGDFITQGVNGGSVEMQRGTGYRLSGRAWLAPFDLGVSQDFELDTVPTDLEDVYEVRLSIDRISGDVSDWKRINRRFLNILRKQFLIWRTLTQKERDRYMAIPNEVAAAAATVGA